MRRCAQLTARRSLHLWVLLSHFLFLIAPVVAQDDAEEESPYRPGLVARYAAGDTSAVRIDEAITFDWGQSPPDPRRAVGGFRAQWTGRLWTQAAGEHRLAAFVGGGKCRVQLGDREVLTGEATEPRWIVSDPIALDFDRHPLSVAFDKTGAAAQFKLFWSGPGFGLEPIPARFLMHDRQATASSQFERGRRLAAALRCGACHGAASESAAIKAPALDKLAGNMQSDWLVDWLSTKPAAGDGRIIRRMPHFGLSRQEAADVAAWLLQGAGQEQAKGQQEQEVAEDAESRTKTKAKGKKKDGPPPPSAEAGEQLFITLGCLACHQHSELGESGLFGGGDLTKIAAKRPPDYFARWLADPASLNRHHRMPMFELTADERTSLSLWLARQGASNQPPATSLSGDRAAGQRLVERFRCASCHALTGDQEARSPALASLSATSQWKRSCAGQGDANLARPGYLLSQADQEALAAYYSAAVSLRAAAEPARGRDLLVELNCLACHAREGIDRSTHSLPATLQEKLAGVVAIHDALGKQVPAMTPPTLNSVGDKLHEKALADAIQRKGPPHRPYLLVRMPKYTLTDEQLSSLTTYFTTTDRIPANPKSQIPNPSARPLVAAMQAAGPRLVTTDGFGCTSCHQVGSVLPDKAPASARGPSLSMLDKRIRREWFDRWCANPSRIVPRMEMPSVQIPVRGVLSDNVGDQLAAVWHILNTPGFEPPEPNPVRVLRLSGAAERKEQPIILHDVITSGDKTYLFPLVIGLPNRHNVLFDLETNRLAAWWLGDTARQRTKGKSWYWEQGANAIHEFAGNESEITLLIAGKEYRPVSVRQFLATVDRVRRPIDESQRGRIEIHYRLTFSLPDPSAPHQSRITEVALRQTLSIGLESFVASRSGFLREIWVASKLPAGATLRFCAADTPPVDRLDASWSLAGDTIRLASEGDSMIRLASPKQLAWQRIGGRCVCDFPSGPDASRAIYVEYTTGLPVDRFDAQPVAFPPAAATPLQIAPGFAATRLPLSDAITPTGLTWNPQGKLILTTLKGEVFVAVDSTGDGLEDELRCLADGLPTPYGVAAGEHEVLVITKSALLRLENHDWNRRQGLFLIGETDEDGLTAEMDFVAAGWGVTEDYHDWAVGLVPGDDGEYFVGLPCQQDQRGEAAARHRGQLLKLVPRATTPDNPRLFDIEVLSSGHRFPMGLARNRDGELFVTDNQGNYNPFNELNHVRRGAHFGFINALEKDQGFTPPRYDKPAIDIPHPWTRSVNGICFLDTPQPLRDKGQSVVFGPLEGHLIGCEYDTRQLIRMTLQKVGDTYQGAAYPLSIAPENVDDGLLGPIVCVVSPRGELYVGNIRDSGWGAGNNVGDIVQIKIEPDKLPCGIAEVRATQSGFTLDFFRPVDRAKAADAANYSIASYRREATPAYGGPNLDRRVEAIEAIKVSPDAKRVTLTLTSLREGCLYEFQLKPLVRGKELFHPAEAHYTLNRIPQSQQ